MASAEIADGVAIANVSLNTEGDNWLYLEYITNKGTGVDDYLAEIVKNSGNVTVTVSPTEFIVGDSNVTVSLNSSSPGTLYIYKDGWGQSFDEAKGNHTIEYLSVGTHIIRVTFENGEDYYSKQFTVNVKPWTPSGDANSSESNPPKQEVTAQKTKITAPAKTFKSNVKTKKYAVTLKSGKKALSKATVYLKIKGKKYSKTLKVKTDAKGKAIFKIKNLTRKGKYTATVTFKGNKNYQAAKQTAKLTVK